MARAIPIVDLVFLWADRPESPSNVGVLLLLEPPPGQTAARAANAIARAYRAARPTAPFDVVPSMPPLAIPRWEDAGRIDMRRHVLRTTLPAPGTDGQLDAHVAELHRASFDRSRPLFEIHVIDGLESGRLAIYVKSHHSSWDGRSALARIFSTFGTRPGPIATGFHATAPAPAPPGAGDAAHPLQGIFAQALAMRELYEAVTRRLGAAREATATGRGNAPFGGPSTRLNRPVVAERCFGRFSMPLDEMRAVGRSRGATINDVLLAVVDGGVHRYLSDLGEAAREPLVAMCPVSQREPGDEEARTKASTLFVPLGRPAAGAARRLEEVAANTRRAKDEMRGLSREASLDFALLAFGLWFASRSLGLDAHTRPVVNFVASNVGGIAGERYLGGCRLVGAWPVSMVADPAGLNFTALSHDGRMDVGIVASRSAVDDVGPLVAHCLAAWTRLRRARPPQDLTLRKPPARKRSRTLRMPPTQRS